MRLHLLSLPHTQTTAQYLTCAYTQKVVKFCRMMSRRGHEVVLYAGEENEAECSEHVVCITEDERAGWFGDGFDTALTPFLWDAGQPYFQLYNQRATAALLERVNMREDILLLTTSWPYKPILDALGIHQESRPMIACEWGVGYEGVMTEFCAFESSAWMHHVYGLRGWKNGRFYDRVIPNFFDPDEFYLSDKGDYLLYVGRLIGRKGVEIAAQIAERVSMPLVVAGPGAISHTEGEIVATEFTIKGDITYVGEVGLDERAKLMSEARALLCPTLYIEPFGGVAVEAMLSGTPVVSTDWGAFRETVDDLCGRRFHTLAEGAAAVERVTNGFYAPDMIRAVAESRYGLEAVAPQFEVWFDQLMGLWGEGWPA